MAAKRFLDDHGHDPDQPNHKRLRTKPTFASVIREAVTVNFLQNFCSALEPMLRRVVNEEVENGLTRCTSRSINRSPSFRIQAPSPSSSSSSSTLQLIFSKKLSLPIFTGSKIVDTDNSRLQLFLVDTSNGGDAKVPVALPHAIKIEIVVLDGDFANGDDQSWTDEEFDRNIVKERDGKRPLLTGDVNITMRDGYASVGEIEFTDNSSWIRSRKFRVGAKVVHGTSQGGVNIRGAMTAAFVVKDHRGELYKKHHPPALGDEVWRLEKIGKDGAFHKKLRQAGITTVQDFLKMSIVDPTNLRRILGHGMSDKMWEVTIKHARTCVMGNKYYVLRGANYTLTLNPICQVVKAVINGQTCPTRNLSGMLRAYIENLVKDAYENWNSLDEVDGLVNETPLLTQGDMVDQLHNQQQKMVRACQQHAFLPDVANNEHVGCNDWVVNDAYLCSPVDSGVHNFSESSLDGEFH